MEQAAQAEQQQQQPSWALQELEKQERIFLEAQEAVLSENRATRAEISQLKEQLAALEGAEQKLEALKDKYDDLLRAYYMQ
eukprot:m51a1_g2760 hypothetical protein (81) ;mRNA; f:975740-975982